MTKQRDVTFDFLKSIAIFLVIWGHSMATGPNDVYHNINGRWIVLLNMPLFMFIVGFFSLSSLKRKIGEMLINKWHTLLVPTLLYGVFMLFPRIFLSDRLLDNGLGGVLCLIEPYWFIWAMMCCLIYYKVFSIWLSRYLNPMALALLSWSIIMFVPHNICGSVLSKVQSLYPFFLMGLLFRYYDILNIIRHRKTVTLIMSFIVFILIYIVFKPNQYFYHFQNLDREIWISSYAMTLIAGTAGIIISYLVSLRLSHLERSAVTWLNNIGQYTLAIYLEQTVVFSFLNIIGFKTGNSLIVFFLALAIFIILSLVTKIISHYPRVSTLLLGK